MPDSEEFLNMLPDPKEHWIKLGFENIGEDENGRVIANCKVCKCNGCDVVEHSKSEEHIKNLEKSKNSL